MSEHTPTPWELFDVHGIIAIRNPRARSSKSEIVFWSGFDASHYPKQARANAAFIVKAVNNHEALVKALEEIEDLGANGATAARLGNIAHAALIALTSSQGFFSGEKIAGG